MGDEIGRSPRRARRCSTWILFGIWAALCLAAPPDAAASGPLVSVGETGGSAESRNLLRRLLIQEVGTTLDGVTTGDSRFELQGTITRLVRLPDPTGTALSCEVSLILVERPGGAVRALLSGTSHLNHDRKRAVEAGGDGADVEEAVRIAVRGALRRLRTALGSVSR